MDFDYKAEEERVKKELESGEFDIDILPNDDVDYQEVEDSDVSAFEKYLGSDSAKSFKAEVFGK